MSGETAAISPRTGAIFATMSLTGTPIAATCVTTDRTGARTGVTFTTTRPSVTPKSRSHLPRRPGRCGVGPPIIAPHGCVDAFFESTLLNEA